VVWKISFLSSPRRLEKKELEVTRGVEDHVEFVAVALDTALEVIRKKGESARGEERRSFRRVRFTRMRRRRVCGSSLSQV
jgi:IS1 family transposase